MSGHIPHRGQYRGQWRRRRAIDLATNVSRAVVTVHHRASLPVCVPSTMSTAEADFVSAWRFFGDPRSSVVVEIGDPSSKLF